MYDESILAALQYARDKGFSGVQVGVESPHLSFERLSDAETQAITHYLSEKNMRLILHAPDENLSLFETSNYLLQGIFSYYEALFSFAERAGAQMVTFHLGAMTTFRTDDTPAQTIPQVDLVACQAAAKSNLQRLIELAGGRSVLCVENYKLDGTILDVLQPHLDGGRLSLCWDLAKTFNREMRIERNLEACFWKNLRHVRQVHLHDRSGHGHSHRVIGSGDIEFMHFLPRLAEADVMDYCIEVRPREKAKESLANLKALLQSA